MQPPQRLPPPAPLDFSPPGDPHFYPVKNWVGSISQGNTPQQAYEALLQHAALLQSGPSFTGRQVRIPGLGTVEQYVDPERMLVVNTAMPGHELYPGNVHRRIVQEGDNLYVVTHGYGTVAHPSTNEHLGPYAWKYQDHLIRRELNPYSLLGNPMDEMNAVPGAVAPQTNASGTADEAHGLISDEPMDFRGPATKLGENVDTVHDRNIKTFAYEGHMHLGFICFVQPIFASVYGIDEHLFLLFGLVADFRAGFGQSIKTPMYSIPSCAKFLI